jgi:hypothetical protein
VCHIYTLHNVIHEYNRKIYGLKTLIILFRRKSNTGAILLKFEDITGINIYKNSWEVLIAEFKLIRHGPHREKIWDTQT